MAMSIQMRKLHAEAKEFDAKLRADHPGFGGNVFIRHDDGTTYYFRYAFVQEMEGEWLAVYTEHHGFHVFHKDEVAIMSLNEVPHDWWEGKT